MNRKNISASILALSLLASTFGQCIPASACAFSNDVYFTYTNHPDFPLRKYAVGELGVIDSGYARSYLFCAYRYLSGKPLTQEEQKPLVSLWLKRMSETDTACTTDTAPWLKLRNSMAGVKKVDQIETERPVNQDGAWQSYCNCQNDAFAAAANTLTNLTGKFGASSEAVSQWLTAQDQVFNNCGFPSWQPKGPDIPKSLPDGSDGALKKQRQYQIAAANFYAQNFVDARKQFEEIAADTSSPWQHIAGYLAVRAMLRQASLQKNIDTALLGEAQKKLDVLIADPSYAKFEHDLLLLSNYIAARLDPIHHVQKLVAEKISSDSVAELTSTLDRLLPDAANGEELKYSSVPAGLKAIDAVDWMLTIQCSDDASVKHAIDRWKQTHSLSWLVAAIVQADSDNPNVPALLKAAASEQSAPAKFILKFHRIRLLIALGATAKARAAVDQLLALPNAALPVSSRNRLLTLRLMLARNLDDFVCYSIQHPAAQITLGSMEQVPDNIGDLEKAATYKPISPVFTPEAGYVMDTQLPLSDLALLAGNKQIPTNLRAHVAWESWVRAVVVGDEGQAKVLATLMRPFNKSKQKLIDSYLAASTADARKFAAVYLMLQFSSAEPNIGWGLLTDDGYGDASGWWWGAKPVTKYSLEGLQAVPDIDAFKPTYLTAAQKSKLRVEMSKISTLPAAPDYFAQTVLAYAKAHPGDDRIPHALSLLIKSTKYGFTTNSTKNLSKQAFQLLHTRYKSSPWTAKTPFWY